MTAFPITRITHNGVTTEFSQCSYGGEHDLHLWRSGSQTEYFMCGGVDRFGPGLIECSECAEWVQRTDVVSHITREHPVKLAPSDGAPATHTGRPAQHSDLAMTEPGCETSTTDALGFHMWWSKLVDEAAPTIQRKANEYGSNSLAEMGRMFARAQGRDRIEDHEALEIGCMIYAKGKLERVLDAMLKGRLPSTDTWMDLMVYSAMSQYIRENKRWP